MWGEVLIYFLKNKGLIQRFSYNLNSTSHVNVGLKEYSPTSYTFYVICYWLFCVCESRLFIPLKITFIDFVFKFPVVKCRLAAKFQCLLASINYRIILFQVIDIVYLQIFLTVNHFYIPETNLAQCVKIFNIIHCLIYFLNITTSIISTFFCLFFLLSIMF